jgi:putative membrane protein
MKFKFNVQTNIMKATFSIFLFLLAAAIFTSSSCNNADKVSVDKSEESKGENMVLSDKDQVDMAKHHNDAKFDQAAANDAQFTVDAAVINLWVIEISNLAQVRSIRPDVKSFAKKMLSDNKKAYDELKMLANRKNITLPPTLGVDEAKDARKLNDENKNFDVKYTSMMVDAHKKAIDRFEKAIIDCKDTELRAWAEKMLPTLRQHVDMSMTLNDRIKVQD